MAVILPATSSSYLHSTTSVSHFFKLPEQSLCRIKIPITKFVLLHHDSYGVATSNVNFEFFNRVYKSIAFRTRDGKATRTQVSMMPIGTPQVPYRNPVEGTMQWVDLWNALITPAMGIYDTMQSLRSPVGTHCVGYVYNLAAYILAAGEKGYRSAMPLSRIALQSPAGAARGQADDIRNETDEPIRLRDYKELSEKTGQPVEKIHKDLDRIKRLTTQEALEYGLIDRVTRPSRIKADAPPRDILQQVLVKSICLVNELAHSS